MPSAHAAIAMVSFELALQGGEMAHRRGVLCDSRQPETLGIAAGAHSHAIRPCCHRHGFIQFTCLQGGHVGHCRVLADGRMQSTISHLRPKHLRQWSHRCQFSCIENRQM